MNRIRRSPKEIQRLCQQYQESGLSQVQFAAQVGVHVVTVRNWLRRFRSSSTVPRPTFVEVRAANPNPEREDSLIVDLPNGVRLRFACRPDPAYLSHTLSALRGV